MAGTRTHIIIIALLTSVAATALPSQAWGQESPVYEFDLPAQDLGDALRAVAARAGWELYAPADQVNGVPAPRLQGRLTARQAIEQLLAGSDLRARFSKGAVIIRGGLIPPRDADAISAPTDIVVTGSHIRGGSIAVAGTTITRESIESRGQTDLGEVVRNLPQNFSGGQNPGVGFGVGGTNANVNSASSINLRGLGPDATLTLLNGHRLPYDSAYAGVDISAIPVAAVDRIEIVTDGASALYGSDAVAGVANVLLRRDFSGLSTSVRTGFATDGGDFETQTTAVGGSIWATGGFIATYDFDRNSAVRAEQRSFASTLQSGTTLFPSQRRHAVTLSGHQQLSDAIRFKLDGLFSKRWSDTYSYAVGSAGRTKSHFSPTVQVWSITPEISADLGSDWRVDAFASYGKDQTRYATTRTPPAGSPTLSAGCYCSSTLAAEISANGPLFRLPAGDLRIALGAGYRRNALDYSRYASSALIGRFNADRQSYYAYGEAEFPLVSPNQNIRLVNRLTVSAAGRFESYPGMARITTPRIALLYAPVRGVDVRAAWGKSFKAPTLYQQYVGYETFLLPAAGYGAGPAGTTILYSSGGNASLGPERARNWTVGLGIHPVAIAGLKIDISWFDIRYRDRVVQPLPGSIALAFSNPAYAGLVTTSPAASLQSGLISGALYGLENYSGVTYDPSKVIAFVDNRNVNVATQSIHGIDVQTSYPFALTKIAKLNLNGDFSYLDSKQQLSALLPSAPLAGTVFNPPHIRARAGADLSAGRWALAAYLNYIGGSIDRRFTPHVHVGSVTSLDLTARISVGGTGDRRPLFNLSLSAINLTNSKPQIIRTAAPTDTPYDSTNFSPAGRFLGLTIARNW
ncbi:TonB-dependent receptor [Sphingomonas sp. OTU376]|uniref:TonB-dependent receptor n=1 Tax=Sphingomonas sp. OTU376 TaxID=3043863 RepID=UPI00313D36F9